MRKRQILAIDDERVILDSITKLCGAEGWHVDEADDAVMALKRLDNQVFDLIICDIMMPRVDGFEFLRHLRKRNIDTPVIITTGFCTVENAVQSLFQGAIDFLPKPFTFDELIACVKRGLNFGDIYKQIPEGLNQVDNPMPYIPCPPRYKRLGYYSWSFLENDGTVRIGVTDLFLRTVQVIEGIELFRKGEDVVQGYSCGHLLSEEQLPHNILSPLSGSIVQANQVLEEDLNLIEKDPYFKGWIYLIIPQNLAYESKHLTPCSTDRL